MTMKLTTSVAAALASTAICGPAFAQIQANQLEDSQPSAVPPSGPQSMEPPRTGVSRFENSSDEIVVTAQKRTERLQDVPVPVSVITSQSMISSNQLRLQDYYTRIPGFQVTPGDFRGAPMLTVRGVTTGGFSNPTVGIIVDDVPFGSSTGVNLGQEAPDLDPSELAQVEVLRGPQGALYGAASLGGLLKYVTVDPSTSELRAQVSAGLNGIDHSGQVGYSLRGAINVPLGETLAVRASGFVRRDPGYIDNVYGLDDVNRADAFGGRLSMLWRPLDALSVKLSALYQESEADGSNRVYVRPGLGEFQQASIRGVGGANRKLEAYSAVIKGGDGPVRVTSITGYNVSDIRDTQDYTIFRGAQAQATYGVAGDILFNHFRVKKFSQELGRGLISVDPEAC